MNRKVSFDCVAGWWKDLSDLQKSAFADDPSKVAAFLDARVKEIAETTFVTHVSDQDAIQLLIQWKGYAPEKAEAIVKAWRKYALHMGYDGPVAWKIKAGFTLKTTAPLAGPCYDKLGYLQNWNFADNPTADSLVFWVPRLAEQSTSKTITQMEAHRAEQRVVHNLPEHHCTSFGSIEMLFALILAHYKRTTGERVPLNAFYAASDTLRAGGDRLFAGIFGSGGLFCNGWDDSDECGSVGCFLLGVEELGQ